MKKLLIALLLTAALATAAFAYNAPLTAAQFESGASAEHADEDAKLYNGTLEITLVNKSAYIDAADENDQIYVLDGRKYVAYFTIPADSFDVVTKFASGLEPTYLAGYKLSLFFNPERIQTVLTKDKNIYSAYNKDGNPVISSGYIDESIIYKSDAAYANYLETNDEDVLASYNDSSKDGTTTAVYSRGSNLGFENLKGVELARWTFTKTDSTDNNWYRTKIYLDFPTDGIANANKVNIHPCINGPVYYYNPGYTGPKFDIVGAMKTDDNKLRFASVYFTGDDYFDSKAEIIEAGVVCYPTALLDDTVLTLETVGAVKIPAIGYYDNSTSGQLVYTGVLGGIESAPDMFITAKSYITYKKDGNTITVYSDPIARSLNTASTETIG